MDALPTYISWGCGKQGDKHNKRITPDLLTLRNVNLRRIPVLIGLVLPLSDSPVMHHIDDDLYHGKGDAHNHHADLDQKPLAIANNRTPLVVHP